MRTKKSTQMIFTFRRTKRKNNLEKCFFFCYQELRWEREREKTINNNPESILPIFDFFVFPIFAFKLCHFKVQTIF
jgi:hypothetical protein